MHSGGVSVAVRMAGDGLDEDDNPAEAPNGDNQPFPSDPGAVQERKARATRSARIAAAEEPEFGVPAIAITSILAVKPTSSTYFRAGVVMAALMWPHDRL
ncbi:hypothetical protein [Rhodococcus aetherivorans]|uniref:hypothetical protein n=1 Tax=Rhodococcus aetherivorans TaxID=191292 RepID=UPI00388FCE86